MKRTLRRYLTASIGAAVATGLVATAGAPASAAPAAPSTSVVGASISNTTDMSRLSGMLGRPLTSVRVFEQTVPTSWSNSRVLATVPDNGTVVLSFQHGTPAQVQAFLSGRPSTTKCYASYFHEPEDDFMTAESKAAYKAKWREYAPAIRAAGCVPTLILMKWTIKKGSGRDYRDWWEPGTVDVMAFDAYNGMSKKCICYTDPTQFLAQILEVSKQTGLPWGLAETGSRIVGDPALRAAWGKQVALKATASGALFVLWWDGPTETFALDSQTAQLWNNS